MGFPFKILGQRGIIKVASFSGNAKEIWNYDQFEALKVFRYICVNKNIKKKYGVTTQNF